MKRVLLSFLINAIPLASICYAQEAFTPAQMEQLARFLRLDRECLRSQMQKETQPSDELTVPCQKLEQLLSTTSTSAVPTPTAVETRSLGSASRSLNTEEIAALDKTLVSKAPLDSAVSSGGDRFEVAASTDASNASIRLGRDRSLPGDDSTGRRVYSSAYLSFSAPLDKSSSQDYTNIATLDGLANAFALAGGYSQIIGMPKTLGELTKQMDALCQSYKISTEDCANTEEVSTRLCRQPGTACARVNDILKMDGVPWMFGTKAKVGYQSYDFSNPTTFASGSARRTPWSAGGYVGIIPSGSLYAFGFEFQHSYQPKKAKTLCPSKVTSESLDCITGVFGPPAFVRKELVYLEMRRYFRFAVVDLKLTHDIKSGDNGLDLPIYLIRGTNSNWVGGFRAGWTNTDHFIAGVFVGSPLGFTP